MGPYFFLELKIYGQWLSGGKRRLCKVANPSSHFSVVGNFVRANLASKVGWKEAAKFLWAVGFAHYLVVFVTLYQRLPISEPLPKELHPVYSMFIAAPSPASIAWETIYGDFDGLSRTYVSTFSQGSGKTTPMLNFLSRFPISFRPSLTCGLSFVTSQVFSGIVVLYLPHDNSISDNNQVRRECPWCSKQVMVVVLLVFTLLHAFVWHTLFPNDVAVAVAIAMKKRRLVKEKKPFEEACDI
jgi:hypothetical protein